MTPQVIPRPEAHLHEGCKKLKHWCRCCGPLNAECQRCSRNRFNREARDRYLATLNIAELLERMA